MMSGLRHAQPEELPDIFIDGVPIMILTAPAYFLVKQYALWLRDIERSTRITLHTWDTWDRMGDRVEQRLGRYLWHPAHWEIQAQPPPYTHPTIEHIAKTREQERRGHDAPDDLPLFQKGTA